MTKLIVTPINMGAPGSFKQRKRLLRAMAAVEQARQDEGVTQLVTALEAIEALVCDHLETDDGTPVADALEMCSADDFDALLGGLLSDTETVPNPKSAS